MTASASSKHRRIPASLLALVALLFAAAACSSANDVETDASAETETTVSDVEASDDAAEGDDDDASTDDTATDSGETEAMGEDEPMDEGVVDDGMADDGGAATETTMPTDVDIDDAELAAAFAASTGDRFSLPFMYITADQDCDGCAQTISLYYVPSEAKPSILTLQTAYVDGVAQADFAAVDPVLSSIDPRRVAELIGASAGSSYGIDPVSGAVTSWTIDGNSVSLRCLQVDTRPVDMRTELCENSIIG